MHNIKVGNSGYGRHMEFPPFQSKLQFKLRGSEEAKNVSLTPSNSLCNWLFSTNVIEISFHLKVFLIFFMKNSNSLIRTFVECWIYYCIWHGDWFLLWSRRLATRQLTKWMKVNFDGWMQNLWICGFDIWNYIMKFLAHLCTISVDRRDELKHEEELKGNWTFHIIESTELWNYFL